MRRNISAYAMLVLLAFLAAIGLAGQVALEPASGVTVFEPGLGSELGVCYWVDGTVAHGFAGCYDDSQKGWRMTCCEAGDACLDNGVCLGKHGDADDFGISADQDYYRGGCMVHDWNSAHCAQFCVDTDFRSPADMGQCDDDSTKWYCKPRPGRQKCSEIRTFELSDNTTIFGTAGWKEQKPSSSSFATQTSSAETAQPSSSELSQTTLIEPGQTSDPVIISLTIENTLSTSATAPPTDPATHIPTGDSATPVSSTSPTATGFILLPSTAQNGIEGSHTIPIGVGVGIGTAVLMALITLVVLYVRKCRLEAPIRAETPPPLDFPDKNPLNKYPEQYSLTPFPALRRSYTGFSGDEEAPFRQPTLPKIPVGRAFPDSIHPQSTQTKSDRHTVRYELP